MRKIIFRGKEKDTPYGPLWRYGDLTHNFNAVLVAGHVVDDETVGQYTGLKGSNGKEIYEGDIVEISHQFSAKQGLKRKFHLPAVVRWDERRARFVVISKEILDSIPDSECVSVIGNIYDNPELLEATE